MFNRYKDKNKARYHLMKKNNIRSIVGVFCAMLMGASFVACKDDSANTETKTVMNVSLNPQVEFVLDANNKVLSVNALNEEGNLIISAEAFENVDGKTAEEAAALFVEVSAETGYLVSGSVKAGENEINVSFSGDTQKAKEIYNNVKNKIDEYLSEENITATLKQAAAITEAQLEALVAECAPYLEAAEVKALEYMELVETLYESRKETADMYSQQLKNAYYEAKAFALEQVELETLKGHLNTIQKLAFESLNGAYTLAVDLIETTRESMLVSENSLYQFALKSFREVKTEYLNYRNQISVGELEVTVEVTAQLEDYEELVAKAEEALLKAGEDANSALDELKTAMKEKYDAIIALLEEYSIKVNEYAEEISVKQTAALESFFTKFEADYADAKAAAIEGWNNMKDRLGKAESAE